MQVCEWEVSLEPEREEIGGRASTEVYVQTDTSIGGSALPQVPVNCLVGAGSVFGARLKPDRVGFQRSVWARGLKKGKEFRMPLGVGD